MNKYMILIIVIAAAAAAVVLYLTLSGDRRPSGNSAPEQGSSSPDAQTDRSYYTCPMHPSVRKNSPGVCPICGMTLVKKADESPDETGANVPLRAITISPARQTLANVATTVASRKALRKEIHAVGRIEYAETGLRQISMRFPGRIERLLVTSVGQQVRIGDAVAEVYSPEAISAQEEYLVAMDSYAEVKDETELVAEGARSLLDQSREKLLRMGFSDKQISHLEQSHKAPKILTIYSPVAGRVVKKNVDPQQYASAGENIFDVADVSSVWLYADVYENEIRFVTTGQSVVARSEALPGKDFQGKVTFISPIIDPESRTVRVRAEVPDPRGELKIDMFLNTYIIVSIPSAIVLPASAVLSSGTRQIVWIRKSEKLFEPRSVKTGVKTEEGVQILEGIEEGDTVVTSGGYLLDSESRLVSHD